MPRKLAVVCAAGLAAALAPGRALGVAVSASAASEHRSEAAAHDDQSGEKPKKQKVNTQALVADLNKLIKSLETEQTTSKASVSKLGKECEATLNDFSPANKAIRRGKSRIAQATDELKNIDASTAAVKTRIDGFGKKISAVQKKIDQLTNKLKDLRNKRKKSKKRAAATLEQLDSVISKVEWDQEHMHRRSDDSVRLSTEVSTLRRLGQQLTVTDDDDAGSAPAASFLQTQAKSRAAAKLDAESLEKLEDDRKDLLSAKRNAEKSFQDEENKLINLIKVQREELNKLQTALKEQQPVLADKLKQAAETKRTISMSKRVVARDTESMSMTKGVCKIQADAGVKINKLRAALINMVKIPAVLIERMDLTLFLERDMQDLRSQAGGEAQAPSFVQLAASDDDDTSSDSGGLGQAVKDALSAAAGATEASEVSAASADDDSSASSEGDSDASMLQAKTGDESTGPFDKVIGMIKALMSNIQNQGNQDTDLNQWCLESKQENENGRFQADQSINAAQAQMLWAKSGMAKLDGDIAFFQGEIPRLVEAEKTVKTALKSETDLVSGQQKTHKDGMKRLVSVLKVLQGSCDLKIDGDIKALERQIVSTWQEMKVPKASFAEIFSKPRFLQIEAGANTTRGGQCKDAAQSVLTAGKKLIELGQAITGFYNLYSSKLTEQAGMASTAKDQRTKDLASAKAARSKRANDFAVAEGDLKKGKKSLELVAKAKQAIEQKCSVKQTHEERMAQRQQEIDALKSAYKVLNGEEIPVGGSFLATGAQGRQSRQQQQAA